MMSASINTPTNNDEACPADTVSAWIIYLNGKRITIRPIRADDAEREHEFIENLSPASRYHRFMSGMIEPSPELLKKLTQIDHNRDEAYVATVEKNGKEMQIGVSRYYSDPFNKSCECAIAVADAWKHHGLGTKLMERLVKTARARGLKRMYSIDAAENGEMRDFAAHLGFTCVTNPDDHTQVIHSLALGRASVDPHQYAADKSFIEFS